MGLRAWNTALLGSILALVLASGPQREKPVLDAGIGRAADVAAHEEAVRAAPRDPARVARLAQAYVEARAPGHAIALVEELDRAGAGGDARVEHAYARALLEQGRAGDALAAERRAIDACAVGDCQAWLLASATRRAEILRELVELGVEDARAEPERAALAYANATREARLAVR